VSLEKPPVRKSSSQHGYQWEQKLQWSWPVALLSTAWDRCDRALEEGRVGYRWGELENIWDLTCCLCQLCCPLLHKCPKEGR
jgi:hypothetical protein